MKKSINIDARMIESSGIGTYIKNILPSLLLEYDIRILFDKKIEIPEYLTEAAKNIIVTGIPVYSLKEQILPLLFSKSNLYWSPHYNIPLLAKRNNKCITTVHDTFHLHNFNNLSNAQKIYTKVQFGIIKNIADHIITVSEFSKSEIIKYLNIPETKISVVYNGVDHKKYFVRSDLVRERFILFVGNIKPHKNLTNLLKAFDMLIKSKEFDDIKLVLVGKKDGFITNDTFVSNFIREKGLEESVIFTGMVSDEKLVEYYQKCMLFVFPSLYEGFGLPPLEAMACGAPCAVSDIPVFRELYKENVVYFDPYNCIDIKNKLLELIRTINFNLLDPLVSSQIINAFNWNSSIDRHQIIFNRFTT